MNIFGTTGQERRAWLDRQGDRAGNALAYVLGPTGIPDRLNALAGALQYTDAGDYVEAADASQALWNDPSLANAARYTAAGAAMALPFIGARGVNELSSNAIDWLADESGSVGPMSAAQRKAQEVLDYLTSGRASEVTDEMMAAADPQYLYRNYDLPMDYDNRMYRASEMGFPVHKYDGESYHLTPNDVQAFNVGHTSTPDHPREAVWTRVDPRTNPAAHNVGRDFSAEGTNDMPLFIRGERAMPFEAREMPDGEYLPYAVSKDWADAARAAGKTQYELGNERVSIDPRNIRSRFARFDPRLSHLRNLSAGAAGMGIALGSVTQQPEEERSAEISAILQKYGVE